ncbi:MAG: hypothetical protein WAZ20_08980 [Methanothrix sp.]|uniref:hypothetical protein n=1 Tax=Methanothrix sp. TaxID=90426 RepID=UPI0032AF0160|nr:hypothetical protein [Euryarchaeota archaeon]
MQFKLGLSRLENFCIKISPLFFEHLVMELLVAMGYGGSRQDRRWCRQRRMRE